MLLMKFHQREASELHANFRLGEGVVDGVDDTGVVVIVGSSASRCSDAAVRGGVLVRGWCGHAECCICVNRDPREEGGKR